MNTTKLQTIHAVDSLEELIGETPLLRLKKISVGMPAQLLVKLEMLMLQKQTENFYLAEQ